MTLLSYRAVHNECSAVFSAVNQKMLSSVIVFLWNYSVRLLRQ